MGRHKEFNVDSALHIAMEVFWTQGYEKTSIQDLTLAMGIKRKSLYDTFKSKMSLYKLCLELYIKETQQQTQHDFQNSNSAIEKLSILFNVFNGNDGRGCFIINTTIELSKLDLDFKLKSQELLSDLRKQFSDLIDQGIKSGEIQDNVDSGVVSMVYMNTWCGLRVLKKADFDSDQMDLITQYLISMIKK